MESLLSLPSTMIHRTQKLDCDRDALGPSKLSLFYQVGGSRHCGLTGRGCTFLLPKMGILLGKI